MKLLYGTAGFRADASILKSTVYRVGILAALRSLKTQSVVGLVITASHNKVTDNGVKIVDPTGGMLSQEWEPFADQLANAQTPETLLSVSKFLSFWMWVLFVLLLFIEIIVEREWELVHFYVCLQIFMMVCVGCFIRSNNSFLLLMIIQVDITNIINLASPYRRRKPT